jgi:hypothetical protein
MNKLEKYINYIVDDLVKDTRIDYDEKRIDTIFPLVYPHASFSFFLKLSFHQIGNATYEHIENKYGVREEELPKIWMVYKGRIEKLIYKGRI